MFDPIRILSHPPVAQNADDELRGNLGTQRDDLRANAGSVVLVDARYLKKSGPLTLNVGMADPSSLYATNACRAEARIHFGNGGINAVTPWFGVSRSMSIPIQASYVRLEARIITAGAVPAVLFRLYGFVNEGSSPKIFSPVETWQRLTVGAGGSANIDTPDFAKAVTIIPFSNGAFSVTMNTFGLAIALMCTVTFAPGEKAIKLPIGDAYQIQVTDLSGLGDSYMVMAHLEF